MRGASTLKVGLVAKTELQPFNFSGGSSVVTTPRMLQMISADLSGTSEMKVNNSFFLRHRLNIPFSGIGDMTNNLGVKVPINDIYFSGLGALADDKTYLTQNVENAIVGRGDVSASLALQVYLEASLSGGSSLEVNDKFTLLTPISSDLSGTGEFELRRLGALDSDTIEFTGLGLKPGQTLIIDTDELDVFIDNILDVDKVTKDSVFFQLEPGENEITFSSPNNPNLQVTLIYQNRWL